MGRQRASKSEPADVATLACTVEITAAAARPKRSTRQPRRYKEETESELSEPEEAPVGKPSKVTGAKTATLAAVQVEVAPAPPTTLAAPSRRRKRKKPDDDADWELGEEEAEAEKPRKVQKLNVCVRLAGLFLLKAALTIYCCVCTQKPVKKPAAKAAAQLLATSADQVHCACMHGPDQSQPNRYHGPPCKATCALQGAPDYVLQQLETHRRALIKQLKKERKESKLKIAGVSFEGRQV
jgi:hypothetical protein